MSTHRDFLSCVVDTLLPGERGAGGRSALPTGTAAGVKLDGSEAAQAAILARIAARAGGEAAFIQASPAVRAAVMRGVEKDDVEAFRALVQALLEDYYEAPPVLKALGWHAGSVQPDGNVVQEADAATLARLDRQRARPPFWRKSCIAGLTAGATKT
jgi:hypothetical protein